MGAWRGQCDGRVRHLHGRDEPQRRDEADSRLRHRALPSPVYPYHAPGETPLPPQPHPLFLFGRGYVFALLALRRG